MRKWNFYSASQLKPQGWLKRQLRIQAEGLSGNLDKVWPDVRDSAWIGGDRDGWERVPYWLDGFIPLAYLLEDEDMILRAKKYMDAILDSQQSDGWICPCAMEERGTYDTWAVQLISKVLTVYYECSGDERVPSAVWRVLRNYYELLADGSIRLFSWGKSRWFETMIAIGFLYERKPEEWLRELARILKEQGADYAGFADRWKHPLNQWTHETHIVNLAMMLKYEAVSYELLGETYRDMAEELREILYRYNGTPVGLFTGDECLSGLSPIQGTELCAVVEQMYSYEWLYAVTGDAKWAERLELLAFNALSATISEDMWTHQYVQMSNQIACKEFPGKSLFRTNGPDAHLYGLEPNFGCCTANFNQGWPKFALSAFMYRENTVVNVVPVPSRLETPDYSVELVTEYPFENTFTYQVDARQDMTLQIRIPSFACNAVADGVSVSPGMVSFRIPAGESREIRVSYDAKPHFVSRPHGLRAAQWGSLVFAVPVGSEKVMREYVRNGVERKFPYCDYELLPTSRWSFGFRNREPQVVFRSVPEHPFSQSEPAVMLQVEVQEIAWGLEDGYDSVCAKIPESREPVDRVETLLLYPYGCTSLRMTELPFVQEAE